MQIGDVTISAALAWIVGAAVGLAAIAKAIDIIKELFGKSQKQAEDKLKRHDELLNRDDRRLTALEEEMRRQQKSNSVLCEGVLSLINHQLSGNDTDKLRDARDKITSFLAGGGNC